jgi:DHA3 family macrolide efflux protein-like MFS transporter
MDPGRTSEIAMNSKGDADHNGLRPQVSAGGGLDWKRRFFTIWSGQSASLFGSSLVQFALVWWITIESGSATVLAIAFMAALVPQVAVGPFAGAIVDRSDRKKVMVLADGGIALATVLLAVLFWLEIVEVWHIMVVLLVRSVGGAFHWPAFMATTSLMVPKEQLARVNGLNQAVFGLANIGGPAVGAVLLVLLPMQGILAIDVLTAVCAIVTILIVAIPNPAVDESALKRSIFRDVREGLRFVRGWPGAMILLGVAAILNFLFTPTDALLPILTLNHFGGGAEEFAALQISIGVGMIVGGAALGVWGGFKRRMTTVCFGLAMTSIATIVIGLAPSDLYIAALVAIFATGSFISIANGALAAVMQAVIPPEMQGRVFSLASSGSLAMTPLGLAIAGPAADMLGPQVWYVFAGVASGLLGVAMLFVPKVMNMENGVPPGVRASLEEEPATKS